MAGWGSANKYALLGAVRAAAQLISYEIPLVLAILAVAMVAGSLNLVEIVEGRGGCPTSSGSPWASSSSSSPRWPSVYRNPFDIPTAESEIVGGPFIEYSGIRWSMFFFAEYSTSSGSPCLGSLVFLGGWNWPLGNWSWAGRCSWSSSSSRPRPMLLTFMWLRVSLPRLRIDQLMSFCWQVLLPLAFLGIIINGLVLVYEWPDVDCWPLLRRGALISRLRQSTAAAGESSAQPALVARAR